MALEFGRSCQSPICRTSTGPKGAIAACAQILAFRGVELHQFSLQKRTGAYQLPDLLYIISHRDHLKLGKQ
jgi:hypothetical protein